MTWERVVEQWLTAGASYRKDTGRALRGFPCAYCGDPASTLDHVIPRVAGGTDDPRNLVPACRSCNGSKSGKYLNEWAQALRSEVARADKRRRALQAVEAMLGIQTTPSGQSAGPVDPASCLHDWQEEELGRYVCSICRVPWDRAA